MPSPVPFKVNVESAACLIVPEITKQGTFRAETRNRGPGGDSQIKMMGMIVEIVEKHP